MKKLAFYVLVVLSLILFASCSSGDDYEKKMYEANEDFSIIIIDVDVENITFLPSTDGKCKVVCFTEDKLEHLVMVDGGKLKIESDDERSWVEKVFSFGKEENRITVYLPTNIYTSLFLNNDTGDIEIPSNFTFDHINIVLDTGNIICNASAKHLISINSDTGDIQINNSTAEDIKLETSTGNITLSVGEYGSFSARTDTGNIIASDISCKNDFKAATDTGNLDLYNVTCKNFASNGDTGEVNLASVLAEELISIDRSTGDIRFEKCDAGEVKITTATGDVIGSFLTEKIIFATTDTGKVDIPKFTTGGKCEITTGTGDIKITISK